MRDHGDPAIRRGTIRREYTFDVLLRGGSVIDGTGDAARRADVGVSGDRARGRRPVGGRCHRGQARPGCTRQGHHARVHRPARSFRRFALRRWSARKPSPQGFTTQLSGNCGDSLAPLTDIGRELVDLSLRANGIEATWRSFGEYLDRVNQQALGPNVAFLVGHGTVRGSVLGAEARAATPTELAAMVVEVEAALEAGAVGLSSGLIYAPGMHAPPAEGRGPGRDYGAAGWPVRDPHAQRGRRPVRVADESIAPFVRLDRVLVSRSRPEMWLAGGLGPGRRCRRPAGAARAEGLDVAADQYPLHGRRNHAAIILPGAARPGRGRVRRGPRRSRTPGSDPIEMERGISGWEKRRLRSRLGRDPDLERAQSPRLGRRSLADLSEELDRDAADLAFDA